MAPSVTPDRGLARVAITRSLAAYLARHPGVSSDAILTGAGIGPDLLADPDALVSVRLIVDVFERAARDTGDPGFGVAYAAQMPWKDLGVLAYVVLHSPTLGSAFGNICRYHAVQQSSGGSRLVVDGDEARLSYALGDPSVAEYGQNAEAVLALYTRACREGLAEPGWSPREIRFRHRAPASTAGQQRYFRCPVRYGEPDHTLVLAASELRRPLRTADPGLLPILVRHADECLARIPASDGFHRNLRRLVLAALAPGDATIEHVATGLGMSARSLQRRLQADGQSFSQVVELTRQELARRYLADPSLTITEAAYLLGYSDLSAFSRAFRRWMGKSAIAYRRDSLAAARGA